MSKNNPNDKIQINSEWDRKELLNSEHDEIILYLLDKENLSKLFLEEKCFPAQVKFSDGNIIKKYPKVIEAKSIKTEEPVKTGYNNYILGYVDLVCNIRREGEHFPGTWGEFISRKNGCVYCKNEEIRNSNCSYVTKDVAIEVKPEVDNFGSLVRQINKYRENGYRNYEWFVVCLTCPSKIIKALDTQNIKVLTITL